MHPPASPLDPPLITLHYYLVPSAEIAVVVTDIVGLYNKTQPKSMKGIMVGKLGTATP